MTIHRFALHAAAVVLATAGAIVACKSQVPAPTLPGPEAPEVTPVGPKPPPIDPKRDVKRQQKKRPRVADVSEYADPPGDGGVDSVASLPPVKDATVAIVRDAAQPLK